MNVSGRNGARAGRDGDLVRDDVSGSVKSLDRGVASDRNEQKGFPLYEAGRSPHGAGQRSYTRLDYSDIVGISLLIEAAGQVAAQGFAP